MARFNPEVDLALYVGDRLNQLLWEKRITQASFAKRIGKSEKTVYRWRCEGVRETDAIPHIAKALGVSIRDRLSSPEEDPPGVVKLNNFIFKTAFLSGFSFCADMI